MSAPDNVSAPTESDRADNLSEGPTVVDPPAVPAIHQIDFSVPPPNYLGPPAVVNIHHQLQQLVERLASLAEPSRDTSKNLTSAGCSITSLSSGTSPSSSSAFSDPTQHSDLDAAFEDLRRRLVVPPSLDRSPPREIVPSTLAEDLHCFASAIESGIDFPTFLNNWYSLASKVSLVLRDRDNHYADTPYLWWASSLKNLRLVDVSTIYPAPPPCNGPEL